MEKVLSSTVSIFFFRGLCLGSNDPIPIASTIGLAKNYLHEWMIVKMENL